MTEDFAEVAWDAVRQMAREHVEQLARKLDEGASDAAVLAAVPLPEYREMASRLLATVDGPDGQSPSRATAAAHLRGLAEGYALGRDEQSVDCVWSGPSSSHVPTRATAQVLIDVVAEARHELVLMTYSARPYEPLSTALSEAVERGVQITVVTETLAGAGGALSGEEPAAAFLAVPGVHVWHWPSGKRTEQGSKLHAKLAVADQRTLFVTSANLTQAGIGKNVEAGLLVRGGTAPVRAAEHIHELQASGALQHLT